MNTEITLRQLRGFVAVAERLHFARAAASLGMAQPPLSVQIQRLEATLGTQLLERDTRHIALTPAGATLLPRAREILRAVATAVAEVRLATDGERGLLRIGYASSLLYTALPPVVARFRRAWPAVVVQLLEVPSADQEALLLDGAIDLGFARDIAPRQAVQQLLFHEQLRLAMPTDHRLAKRRSVTPADLSEEEFVLFERTAHPLLHDRILSTLHAEGITARIVQECEDWPAVLALVRAGLGISIVPDSFRLIGADRVELRPFRAALTSTVTLVLRPGEPAPWCDASWRLR